MTGWLIVFLSLRKTTGGFKDKIVSLFKTNTPKQTVHGRRKKLSKSRKQNIKKSILYQKKTFWNRGRTRKKKGIREKEKAKRKIN